MLFLLVAFVCVHVVVPELRELRTNEFCTLMPRLLPRGRYLLIYAITQISALMITAIAGIAAWGHTPAEENTIGIYTFPPLYGWVWAVLWCTPQAVITWWLAQVTRQGRRSILNEAAAAPGGIYQALQPVIWRVGFMLSIYSLFMVGTFVITPGHFRNLWHFPAMFIGALPSALASVFLILLLSLKLGRLLTVLAFIAIASGISYLHMHASYACLLFAAQFSRDPWRQYYYEIWWAECLEFTLCGIFDILFCLVAWRYLKKLRALPARVVGI